MRARPRSSGFLALVLGALPLACGAPFTTTSDSTGTTTGTGGATSSVSSSTGGAGGGGSGGQGTGTTGGGTGGKMPECTKATDCPGADTQCKKRSCTAGVCGFDTPMAPTDSQVWGDCQTRACDGQGNLMVSSNPDDVYDDGNACTIDICNGPEPKSKPQDPGFPCDGGVCNGAGRCVQCVESSTCPLDKKNCSFGRCVPLHCVDNFLDMGETALDCGGNECAPCKDGLACNGGIDCVSNVCQGQPKVCKPANCNDGVTNGSETDIDCGGKCAAQGLRCNPGHKCARPEDCASGVCQAGFCQMPICTDGVKNGAETDIDCGGSCGPCLPP
jgi:hypothetical protein